MLTEPESVQLTLLAVIAGATAVIAVVQIALVVAGIRLVRRVNRLAETVENDIRPALGRFEQMSSDAARVATAAADLAEQTKAFLHWVSGRADGVFSSARFVLGGRALAAVAGVRAALESFVGGNGPAATAGGPTEARRSTADEAGR